MKTVKTILLSFLFITVAIPVFSQTNTIDSLRHGIAVSRSDKEKLELIIELSNQSINADSLLPYILTGEAIALKTNSRFDIDRLAAGKAGYYVRKNHIDSALSIVEPLIGLYKKDKDHQPYYLTLLFLKARILDRGNRYTQALTQLYRVAETADIQKDTLTLIQAKTGIGWVQMEMEQYNEALSWLYNALHTSADKRFYKNYGALYSNIAATYNALGKTDSAKHYIDIAIKDARGSRNQLFLATALSMQAKIFIDSKQPHLAEAPLHEVVLIRKELNDPFYTVYDMSSLASYYAANNQTQKGIQLCMEGIELAKKSGLSSQLLMIYRSLSENYKAAGKIAEYSSTLELIIALKDSFNNINSARLLANMQAANEAGKKEKTIAEQQLNLTKKNYWLFGSALFAIMAGIIIWLGFKYYNRKQQTKMALALAEEKRIASQSIIQAEEQERKRIAADLHDNIGAYASAIRADVENLASNHFNKDQSLQNLQQHSQEIINSLRDTIWVLNKENITITGISDRIKNYVNKLQPSYPSIQFNISEAIENNVRISSQHALNIFRIVQEAIHNALKHSSANEIDIAIGSNETVSILIADNGKGFSDDVGYEGNGLLNMHARAQETGMDLSINSAPDKGTSLLLQTNTTN